MKTPGSVSHYKHRPGKLQPLRSSPIWPKDSKPGFGGIAEVCEKTKPVPIVEDWHGLDWLPRSPSPPEALGRGSEVTKNYSIRADDRTSVNVFKR